MPENHYRNTSLRLFIFIACLLLHTGQTQANQPIHSAQIHWHNITLKTDGKNISVFNNRKIIIALTSISFNYEKPISWEINQAHEDRIILRGRFPAQVDFFKLAQDIDDRFVDLHISKTEGGFHFYAKPHWGRQVRLHFQYLGDHFFGLTEALQPDNRLSPNITGTSIDVEVNSENAALRENYASAFSAFYISSSGYGAFFDSFARGRYDFDINGKNTIHHETGTLDWHLFFGDYGAKIHQAYYSLIGAPKTLPAWGLGPIGWRDQNNGGATEILNDIQKMNELRIPFSAWFVDRPYSDGSHAWSQMNFNSQFANPEIWIKKIREDYGLEFMTWTATSTFGDTRFEKHLAGKFTYLDLSHPKSVENFQNELSDKQLKFGVKGHKIDRGDEAFPVYEDWFDASIEPAARRNTYVYLMAKVHDQVLRKHWGNDQITFTRSAIHRSQPYLSAIWAGDPRTSWEGLQANFANAARSSFMGFPVWGTDVGGYQGEGYIPEKLYIRWLQAGSMSGLFEIKLDGAGGEGRDRMPWRYDKKFQQLFQRICADRMDLLPYLYSLTNTSAVTGTVMQPMAYRHLNDAKTYEQWDQFYLGEAILVAPVFTEKNQRSIYLPKGKWRDYDNSAIVFDGGKTINLDVPIEKLPRFVRENSIFVTGNIYTGSDRIWETKEKQLSIHLYPGTGTFSSSLIYVDMLDNNTKKNIEAEGNKNQLQVKSPIMLQQTLIDIILDKNPKAVVLNGKNQTIHYDHQTKKLKVLVEKNQAIDLQVNL